MSAPVIILSDCRGIGGLLFGHHYEPRYSTTEREKSYPKVEYTGNDLTEFYRLLSRLTDKMYHGDVCTRCGHTVNQPASRSSETASP